MLYGKSQPKSVKTFIQKQLRESVEELISEFKFEDDDMIGYGMEPIGTVEELFPEG